ncbi:uncharacterized protein LOC9656205 [Selaginella moellendorffii]|uniref:uncharacterized protein LOC9656209 n=1 Tax=Selaginella moellendorffii TaxID=88036 RepID=UPI000D1C2139|nr:uncharacterized protein LOC9656209 [Selaginella moellendorffii]XP_024533744.1 uncharacterized protein LOC9656205 [Selaginella moellendorffii]XP_024533749.1 uncharacterized protein LOC9656205 [Selaginella moellendorffii]|eukprot:XP_024531985.1 uncharacterized protein LOC9656209 [Selaginella moellendorffii]
MSGIPRIKHLLDQRIMGASIDDRVPGDEVPGRHPEEHRLHYLEIPILGICSDHHVPGDGISLPHRPEHRSGVLFLAILRQRQEDCSGFEESPARKEIKDTPCVLKIPDLNKCADEATPRHGISAAGDAIEEIVGVPGPAVVRVDGEHRDPGEPALAVIVHAVQDLPRLADAAAFAIHVEQRIAEEDVGGEAMAPDLGVHGCKNALAGRILGPQSSSCDQSAGQALALPHSSFLTFGYGGKLTPTVEGESKPSGRFLQGLCEH